MKLGKLISSLATAAALVASSLGFVAAPAQAVTAQSDLYGMNIANESSGGDATNFVTANGVTYFTVNTFSQGRTIWSIADTAGAVPQLVVDPIDGRVTGRPDKLSVIGNLLFFWEMPTTNWTGYRPYVFDLTTKVLKEIKLDASTELRTSQGIAHFVGVGGKVYFIAEENMDGDSRLFSYDTTANSGTAVVADELVVNEHWGSDLWELDGKVFYYAMLLNGCCSSTNTLKMYDPATDTVSATLDSTSTAIADLTVYGTYNYKGANVLLAAKGSWQAGQDIYTVDSTGLMTKIVHVSDGYAPQFFFNFKGELYARPYQWGTDAKLVRVSQADGSFVSMNETMFPGSTGVDITNGVIVGNYYMFSGFVNGTTKEKMYKWDGVGSAEQTGTLEATKNRFTDYVYNGGGGSNSQMGVVGNKLITNLALDDSIGYEPYLIGLDGSTSLVKNFNNGSEGSDPDTQCIGSANGKDYMPGNLPQLNTQWGQAVIVETYSEGGYLRYNVINPGAGLQDACGFAAKGTDLYFTAYDNIAQGDGLYKMAADHTVTKVTSMNHRSRMGTVVGDRYYYWNDSYSDLWYYDMVANEDVQLTGNQTFSGTYDDYMDNLVFVGNKAFFYNEDRNDYKYYLYSVDLAAATYVENKIAIDPDANTDSYYDLKLFGGNLYAAFEAVNGQGPNIYKIDPTTRVSTKVADLDPNGDGWVNSISTNGTDIYANYHSDTTNKYSVIKLAGGTTKTVLALPNGEEALCAAAINNDVVVSNTAGDIYFYGAGGSGVRKSSFAFGQNDDSLCYSVNTALGTYLEMPEYSWLNGPWDYEYGFIGATAPWANTRFGQPANEAPAAPATGDTSTYNAVAPGPVSGLTVTAGSGSVNLSWTAPTVGTTPQYAITSTPAGAVCAVVGNAATCTGTAGTSYTFTVVPGNSAGVATGVTSSAITMPASGSTPAKVDTDNPNLGSLTETKTFKGTTGSVVFPDGSGFDIDAKGRIFSKVKSKYLTSISGTITATYFVGSKAKTFTCKLKAYGSTKKLKALPRNAILYKTKQACQLPAAAITSLKAGKLTIVQNVTVKRFYATTGLAVDKVTKKKIKAMVRKMTVKFTK